jgi:hypothetical protein
VDLFLYTLFYKIERVDISIVSTSDNAECKCINHKYWSFVYTLISVKDSSEPKPKTGSASYSKFSANRITGSLNTCIGSTSNLNGSGTYLWVSSILLLQTVDNTGLVKGLPQAHPILPIDKDSNACENYPI